MVRGYTSDGVIYSYARYGDGEFRSILGWRGNNAGEHDWTPELQEDLTLALTSSPQYRLATVIRFVGMPYHRRPGDLDTYLAAWNWLDLHGLDFEWYDQEVWADSLIASTKIGSVMPLLEFLRSGEYPSVLLVGPDYLHGLRELFHVFHHVITPSINCHADKKSISEQVIDAINGIQRPVLCLLSASMVAEVLIHDLHPILGSKHWLIDVGSIWDPYLGRNESRSYWKAMGKPVV